MKVFARQPYMAFIHGITQEVPMFGFPVSTSTNLIKNTIDAQFSFLSAISESIVNTSLQISELNVQAMRKLMEESASDVQRALQIKSPIETGSFLVEQSQATIEKVRGYQQNVQRIVMSNQVGLQKILDVPVTDGSSSLKEASGKDAIGKDADASVEPTDAGHVHAGHVHHEQEHRAPPLVEKLIASAVNDTEHRNHKS